MRRSFALIAAACGVCGAAFACSSFSGEEAPPPPGNADGGDAPVDPARDGGVDAADAGDASCSIVSLAMSGQGHHVCAVKSDGTVWCWGNNASGQLGLGKDGGAESRPLRVSGIADAVEVAVGVDFTCARTRDGRLYCWGSDDYGQLGLGGGPSQLTPKKLPSLSGIKMKALAAGAYHACAISSTDELWCWGYNVYGGVGPTAPTQNPVVYPLNTGLATVAAVSAGSGHTCAITTGGVLTCWGLNDYAQLGVGPPDAGPDGGLDFEPHPNPAVVFDGGASEVSAGVVSTCARVDAGLVCWGYAPSGQTGTGSTALIVPVPTRVRTPGGVTLEHVAMGYVHACATSTTGAWCWGYNDHGEIGPSASASSAIPVFVAEMRALSIHVGEFNTCARMADGPPLCWGESGFGELGRGLIDDGGPAHPVPAPVESICP